VRRFFSLLFGIRDSTTLHTLVSRLRLALEANTRYITARVGLRQCCMTVLYIVVVSIIHHVPQITSLYVRPDVTFLGVVKNRGLLSGSLWTILIIYDSRTEDHHCMKHGCGKTVV
jgi:hypothetical protein